MVRRTLCVTVAFATLSAHDTISTKLTWCREISRIVYRRCAGCHRKGGSAPMSLVTWREARPWAAAISDEVLNRRMPPWGAVKGFGEFRNDMALTQDELQQIADWAAGGAPEGDPSYLPPPELTPLQPLVPSGAVVRLTGAYTLPAAAEFLSVRPSKVAEGSSLRVIAVCPDESVLPVIWLRNFRPSFVRDYEFQQPLSLQEGTRLLVVPAGAGTVELRYRPL